MTRPVVVLTALDLEYNAVRERLTKVAPHVHPMGTRFERGTVTGGSCEIILGLVGKGNHPSAVIAERAMTEFDPEAVIFAGVAGALWPSVGLGDVVVATHVYAYHGGTSESDAFRTRPRVWEIPHACDQLARHLERERGWARGLAGEVPQVRFGPIAAGEVVLDSASSPEAKRIRDHYNDALAVEMESAGVAQAAHLNRSLPAVVVRGISDRADGTKVHTDGGLMFVFDGGVLTADQTATIRLCPDELDRYDFIEPERLDEVLIPRLARRVATAVTAIGHGGVYLEDGRATASR
ncbi:8-oxo-dGTP diphosphatase [Micromonospora phaseoli]|uniref:8-oxo-dGTP diphosphatase n=1 Tax=Micromonospora phaseoli TaxID=1144548 RepID=A0A1H7CXB4_9ACTN|nr:nucleoside phosphorylase [Micromonospora phaseoli]GIJ80107.1 hypothetical protein Xph01_45390 [Micromonospora phaseoli]SEJ93207.1 8-oxo-dGTP diphosphatase [Micromonospora phaseoli]